MVSYKKIRATGIHTYHNLITLTWALKMLAIAEERTKWFIRVRISVNGSLINATMTSVADAKAVGMKIALKTMTTYVEAADPGHATILLRLLVSSSLKESQ